MGTGVWPDTTSLRQQNSGGKRNSSRRVPVAGKEHRFCINTCRGISYCTVYIKGTVPQDFDFRFFHKSVSLKLLSIPLRPTVSTFFKNSKRYSQPEVQEANEKKSLIRKVLIILFEHLWVVELTYR